MLWMSKFSFQKLAKREPTEQTYAERCDCEEWDVWRSVFRREFYHNRAGKTSVTAFGNGDSTVHAFQRQRKCHATLLHVVVISYYFTGWFHNLSAFLRCWTFIARNVTALSCLSLFFVMPLYSPFISRTSSSRLSSACFVQLQRIHANHKS